VEPLSPQHDETIVPVRPGLRAAPAAPPEVASALPARRRSSERALLSAAAAVLAVAAAAVFWWLPRQVEREREAAAAAAALVAEPAPVVAEPAGPALTPQGLAALEAQSQDLLAELLTRQAELTALNLSQWAPDEERRYRELSEAGDTAFLANDYAAAVARYTEAKALGEQLVARAASTAETALAAGEAALAAGNVELALRELDRVLVIEPGHGPATRARERAERLPEVLALVQRGDGEAQRGEWEAAQASYREALAIDAEWPAAAAGTSAANRALRDAEFERRMSAGFARLADEDHAAARAEFEAALALRPGAAEAQDGIVQADQGAKLAEIALAEARALAFERRELWDQAVALYRAALAGDATLVFAQTGLARAEVRAGLDAKLVNLIDNPTLLYSDNVLADAGKLLEEAAAAEPQGPRIEGQIARLRELVTLAATPLPVELRSDAVTQVTLYRVGALGAFAAKQVELRPGTYTVIGSRDGYRDVRRTFTVRPGGNLAPIDVVCVEQI
jgi:hypothetical protein